MTGYMEMAKCNRKQRLLGKSIRRIRMRRNFGIKPCADGSIRFTDETIQSCVCTWWSWKEFLKEGKITREEYENRKDSFLR